MRRRARSFGSRPALCLLALLAACATQSVPSPPPVGNVELAVVPPPPGASRLQLDPGQGFVFPLLLESTMPAYPPDLLALRLAPVRLCVDVDIDAQGNVGKVALRDGAGCASATPHAARFAEALEQAVTGWRYDPALVCRTPDGRAAEDACTEPDAIDTPVALRLSYAFVFSQQDGRPRVELASGGD